MDYTAYRSIAKSFFDGDTASRPYTNWHHHFYFTTVRNRFFNLQKEKIALVVEGGGMRGIYTAGVLEAFMQQQFDPFHLYIGVSAGCCNLSNFIAGHQYKNAWTYLVPMRQADFANWRRFMSGGHFFDINWLLNENQRVKPIDVQSACQNLQEQQKEFLITATDIHSGNAVYFSPNADNWLDCLRATCAIPVFYRTPCAVGNVMCVDGGLADPIPVKKAYNMGARTIVVLRTRSKSYVKTAGIRQWAGRFFLRGYPALASPLQRHPNVYMDAVSFIQQPPADVKIVQIAPPAYSTVNTATRAREKLLQLYACGKQDGLRCVQSLRHLKSFTTIS